jgi:hypothetical protein
MQQRKALAQELPVKAVVLKHQKAVVVSMLLTWLLSAGMVVVILMSPVWLQNTTVLPGNDPAGQQHCHHYAVHRLSARRAGGGSFGASRTFIVGSLLLAVSSWAFYHLSGSQPEQLFLLYGAVGLCVGVVGRCLMSWCAPSRRKCASPVFILVQRLVRHFWRPDADCGDHADGRFADGAGLVRAGAFADGAGIRDLAASGMNREVAAAEGELQRLP